MARESFDKEIQLLRMLVLTSGAYTRQQRRATDWREWENYAHVVILAPCSYGAD